MQHLRSDSQTPERRGPDHVCGDLPVIEFDALCAADLRRRSYWFARQAGPKRVSTKQVRAPHSSRRPLGVLGLNNSIASADVMQHEIAKRMNDLFCKRLRHRLQIARRLWIIVEWPDLRACGGRDIIGTVTDCATKFFSARDIRIQISEYFLPLLHQISIHN